MTVSVFLQKQNYLAEMPIFDRKTIFLSLSKAISDSSIHVRKFIMQSGVINFCRNKIIFADKLHFCRYNIFLQKKSISAEIVCFWRIFGRNRIFCHLEPQKLVSVFLLKFCFGCSLLDCVLFGPWRTGLALA